MFCFWALYRSQQRMQEDVLKITLEQYKQKWALHRSPVFKNKIWLTRKCWLLLRAVGPWQVPGTYFHLTKWFKSQGHRAPIQASCKEAEQQVELACSCLRVFFKGFALTCRANWFGPGSRQNHLWLLLFTPCWLHTTAGGITLFKSRTSLLLSAFSSCRLALQPCCRFALRLCWCPDGCSVQLTVGKPAIPSFSLLSTWWLLDPHGGAKAWFCK